jgi:hypothetical protein
MVDLHDHYDSILAFVQCSTSDVEDALKQSKANSANGVEESRIMRQGSSGTWHSVLHMLVVLVVSLSVPPVPRTGHVCVVYVVYVFLCFLCLCLCWWFDMVEYNADYDHDSRFCSMPCSRQPASATE